MGLGIATQLVTTRAAILAFAAILIAVAAAVSRKQSAPQAERRDPAPSPAPAARPLKYAKAMPGASQSGKIPGGTKSGRARGCGMKFAGYRLRLSASDVANFVACQHMTRLDLLTARGELRRARGFDLGFQDLVKRGEAHELTVLDTFRADGRSITEITQRPDADAEAAQATLEAIRSGTDVIYQGVLLGASADGGTALLGRPDFLVRADLLAAPDGKPRPDELHYEVVEAKLARTAKARAVAQTAFYSHLLAVLQGVPPRWMHLALGRGDLTSLKQPRRNN